MDRDGDVLVLFTEDENGLPRIQYIPAHRIGQRTNASMIEDGEYAGCEMHHGVITYQDTPIAYQILSHKKDEDLIVSTENAMLLFDSEINGFPRGIPLAAFALDSLEDMMVTKVYEQQALKLASEIGIVETNPEGASNDYEAAIENANWQATWDPTPIPVPNGADSGTIPRSRRKRWQADFIAT